MKRRMDIGAIIRFIETFRWVQKLEAEEFHSRQMVLAFEG